MKTKYIKVAVSERLPDNEGDVYVKYIHRTDIDKYYFLDEFNDKEYFNKYIEYWLCEVPDREQEMKEVLIQLISHYEDVLLGDFSSMALRSDIDSAKQLIQELK